MWMNLYNFTHSSLGMHFWDLPALLAGVIILVEQPQSEEAGRRV